jgi:SPP1 family predicted phage head-tail adaptor
MEAGRLRHRVTIQEKVDSRDSYGGERETWVDIAEVWAEVEPLVGREYLESRQESAEITTRVRVRYRAGIRPEMRVKYVDEADVAHYYDIFSAQNVGTRRKELVLVCREQV